MLKYILLLQRTKNKGINILKVNFFVFMYLDAELQRRLPNKVAVLLKFSILCSERMCLCIQGTYNTARDMGFSGSNISKIDFH